VGFTRNLENAMPLGFVNDVKIPQRVTRAPLSRAEHAYELFLPNYTNWSSKRHEKQRV
jgi:hypothetical protein